MEQALESPDQQRRMSMNPPDVFSGGGEMGALMRAHDWTATAIGPVAQWPQSLRTAVSICLASRFPILIWWGPDLVMLYNDAYRPILGATKHPQALGQAGRACWPEIWDIIGPMLDGVLSTGTATWSDDQLLVLDRNGYLEECYFTFSYSPIRDESGGVGGVFCAVTETTEQVLSTRRLAVLRAMAEHSAAAQSVEAACQRAMTTLAAAADVPCAALYRYDADAQRAWLTGTSGCDADLPAFPPVLELDTEQANPDALWPLAQLVQQRTPVLVDDLVARGCTLPGGTWPDPPQQALLLPVSVTEDEPPAALLIVAINPRRALDAAYRSFLGLVATQLASAIATARTYEAERQRAEALAELDRAKTAFFANVSHEFRTPLTLMLGPLEDILAQTENLTTDTRAQLGLVQRNALRLLNLVNQLLAFARIEAGRLQASYAPTDLAAITADLASIFRAAIERARLRLIVTCPPLAELVYVDRALWEQIVVNLLSNAVKFTLAGEIEVALRQNGAQVDLVVRDTGTGIPADELPQLFTRFHRVKEARGRSFEGSGIGLALVQELVQMHGGSVRVDSVVDQGTTVTVSLPLGTTHLPADRIEVAATSMTSGLWSVTALAEAQGWLPEDVAVETPAHAHAADLRQSDGDTPVFKILLADDNADMRAYVARLLRPRYELVAVGDGAAALAAAQAQAFDLILSDVMMPQMDGIELLRALRAAPQTRAVPVILLSARAGEEARVEGLDLGADDYLVKPFSARELLARVETHLKMARIRQEAAAVARSSEERFRLMADYAPVMVWVTEPDGNCSYLSKSWYEFTGQTPETGLGFGWLDAVHPDDRPTANQTFFDANAQRAAFRLDYRLRRSDGAYCWAIDSAAPRFGPDGTFLGYIGSVMDISERKQAEDALRESEARFRTLVQSTAQIIWTARPDGHFVGRQASWERFTGQHPTEYADGGGFTAVHFDDRASVWGIWRHALENLSPFEIEYRLRRYDGQYRHVRVKGAPVFDAEGAVMEWVGVGEDVTERKRRELNAAFLTELADDLARLASPDEIMRVAAARIAAHLNLSHCVFVEINTAADEAAVLYDHHDADLMSLVGVYRIAEFHTEDELKHLGAGRTVLVNDVRHAPRPAAAATRFEALHIRALIHTPYLSDGRWTFLLSVQHRQPYQWRSDERDLVQELTARIYPRLERARTEEALRESEERFRSMFESIDEGFCIVEMIFDDAQQPIDYRFLQANPAFEQLTGLRNALGRTARDLVPDLESFWFETYGRVALTGESVRFENGSEPMGRWFDVYASRVGDAKNRRVAIVFNNITERKQLEVERERLLFEEQQQAARLWRLNAAAVAINAASSVEWVLRRTAQKARALIGTEQAVVTLVPDGEWAQAQSIVAFPDSSEPEVSAIRISAEIAHLVYDERRTLRLSRAEFAAKPAMQSEANEHGARLRFDGLLAAPLIDDDGTSTGMILLSNKIAGEFTAADEALLQQLAQIASVALENQTLYAHEQHARTQAEEASRLKDEFLATVSHELRTPLTALLGYAHLLQSRQRDEAYVARTVKKMVQSARSQAQIIEDLLDVSRIVNGKLRIESQPIDLVAVIRAALDTIRPALEAKELQLQLDLHHEAVLISGDPNRLQQVVWNLLANAAKFTPPGGSIRVSLGLHGRNVQLIVSDTGQGISAAFLPYVFDRFRQADSTSNRVHSGLGLGLSIVRHLVELHGGSVQATSAGPGQGATFTVRLPLAAYAATSAFAAAQPADDVVDHMPDLRGLRVLLVDDQMSILELLHDVLTPCGAIVRMCTTAREGLETLQLWQPDVLVSDIAMPGEDGYWLIDHIRALPPEEGGAIPAVALTAYVRVEERMRVLASGFQLYVPKPVEPAELRDVVVRLATMATNE